MARVLEAVSADDVETLQRLLDEEPGLLEAEDPIPPLAYAPLEGSVEAARLLLYRGAGVISRDSAGG